MTFGLPALFTRAVAFLRKKGLLPTSLSSAEMKAVEASVRRRAVFSARLTQVKVLQRIKDAVEAMLGGRANLAEGKLAMQQELEAMGYTAEGGFPQDAEGTVPPATEGTLRDLKSEERMELVLRTQYRLAANEAFVTAGLQPDAVRQFPTWELVRVARRNVPRGLKRMKVGLVEDPGQDWPSRWLAAGGELFEGRMVALKSADVWQALGDGAGGFEDTLGNPFPPFAFNSGYGLREIKRAEALLLGVLTEDEEVKPKPIEPKLGEEKAMEGVSDETLDLWRTEKERRARGGKKMTVAERLAALGVPASDYLTTTPAANTLQERCTALVRLLQDR